jgi:hypothetical protein
MFQQLPTLVVLQPATGTLPIDQLTDCTSDFGDSQASAVRGDLPHQLQFIFAEHTACEGELPRPIFLLRIH